MTLPENNASVKVAIRDVDTGCLNTEQELIDLACNKGGASLDNRASGGVLYISISSDNSEMKSLLIGAGFKELPGKARGMKVIEGNMVFWKK